MNDMMGLIYTGEMDERLRERLADPIMALERDPVSSSYIDHVFESREGARGGMGGAGGGCGCN